MRVTVTKVRVDGLVEVTCLLGSARALWRGTTSPTIGDHDVELDCPEPLAWGASASLTDESPSLRQAATHVVLTAFVLDLDDNDVLTVDVGGHPTRVGTVGTVPVRAVGRNVRLVSSTLELYPTGLSTTVGRADQAALAPIVRASCPAGDRTDHARGLRARAVSLFCASVLTPDSDQQHGRHASDRRTSEAGLPQVKQRDQTDPHG